MKNFFQKFRFLCTTITIASAIFSLFTLPIWADSQLTEALKGMKVSQKELMETIELLLAQGQITPEQAQQARLEVSNMNQSDIDRAQGEAVELIGKQSSSPVVPPAAAETPVPVATAIPPSSSPSTASVPKAAAVPTPSNPDEQLKEAFKYFNQGQ